MVNGIRFREGRIIDFQDTPWEIQVDVDGEFIDFMHDESGRNIRFRSDGVVEPEQAFEFASAILFEGTDWEIDAEAGELTIDHDGTTFAFDEEGGLTIPEAFEIAADFIVGADFTVDGDITFEGKIDFDNTDWEIEVDDDDDALVFEHVTTGEQFRWNPDGSLDVPDVFVFEEEDIEFASVRVNTMIELAEYDDLSEAPQNPRSIYRATGNGPYDEGLWRWDPDDEEYVLVGPSNEQVAAISMAQNFMPLP